MKLATIWVSIFLATLLAGSPAHGGAIHPHLARALAEIADDPAALRSRDLVIKDSPGEPRIRVLITLADALAPIRARQDGDPLTVDRVSRNVATLRARAYEGMPTHLRNRIDTEFKTFAVVAGYLTASEIAEMAALDDVAFVQAPGRIELTDNESHVLTHVNVAHDDNLTGMGTVIAVYDEGFDTGHPAFADIDTIIGPADTGTSLRIAAGFDASISPSDTDPTAVTSDGGNHGTRVAGIAAANFEVNGELVRGVAYESRLALSKSSCYPQEENPDPDELSTCVGLSESRETLMHTLEWINGLTGTQRVDLLSLSLRVVSPNVWAGTAEECASQEVALDAAFETTASLGIITFAAAGNEGFLNQIASPACLGSVISVGAVYDDFLDDPQLDFHGMAVDCNNPTTPPPETVMADEVACFGNRAENLDVFAPSYCARTAEIRPPEDPAVPPEDLVIDCFGGTSAAAPFAAGVAALLIEAAGPRVITTNLMRELLAEGPAIHDSRAGIERPRVDFSASLTELGERGLIADSDNDGHPNYRDNCIDVANSDQRDTDGDHFGNVCDTDLNNDAVTNAADLSLFRSLYFSSDPDADFNGDGTVNAGDLGFIRDYFFETPGPSGYALAVPAQ